MEWWDEEEIEMQPGISIFKGMKLDPVDKPATKVLFLM